VSNDPDLIEQTCRSCEGDGGWLEDVGDDEGSVYVDCSRCGGTGLVIAE
jgi:DnaJ-class molecular chaperone